MVAVDGVDAVPRPDATQHRGDLLRLLHGLPGVIKNVARNDDRIGILLVYARDHAFHLRKAHVVAEVEIGEQHDLHALHAAGGLVYGDLVGRDAHDAGVDHAADGGHKNGRRAQTARDAVHPRRAQRTELQTVDEQQPQSVREQDCQQQIEQHAEPIVPDEHERALQPSGRQRKGQNKGERKEGVQRSGHGPMLPLAEPWEPRPHPAHDAAEQIEVKKQVKRCEEEGKHGAFRAPFRKGRHPLFSALFYSLYALGAREKMRREAHTFFGQK